MFSLTLSRPLIISLAVVSTIGIVSAAFFQFSGTAGTSHSTGIFSSDGITGNAGTISFDPALTALCGGSTAGLEGVDLKGYFCLQTLGKATFINATIIPSPSRRATDLWTVVGTANSSGGLIYFQSGSYHTYYDPDGRRLVGE